MIDLPEQLEILRQLSCGEVLAVVLIILLAGIACLAIMLLWEHVKAHFPRSRSSIVLLVCLAGLVHYGATKNWGTVRFPYTDWEARYLIDAGSYVTNDYVHVAWTRSPLVPDSADFIGAARLTTSTNDEDWAIFFVSDFAHTTSPTNIPFVGAQTNNFQFFSSWTPGPTVHTNGVAMVLWQMDYKGETNKFATLRTGVYKDGIKIAPNPAITNGPSVSISVASEGGEE